MPDELCLISGLAVGRGCAHFYKACKVHDKCYETYGNTKESCDKEIHQNLKSECGRAYNTIVARPARIACEEVAINYYRALRDSSAAETAYNNAQRASSPRNNSSVSSVEVVNKIALRSDNGQYLARCDGCVPKAAYPNIAFIHADTLNTPYAQWDLIKLSNEKYALRADNGVYMARCEGCIPKAAYPNTAFIHAETASTPYAQWDLIKLSNGKYALRADNGSFLARCDGCAPNSAYPNIAFIHAGDYSSRYAQWDMIVIK